MNMWFITDAWARRGGGQGGVQHNDGALYQSDSEIGRALIIAAILIVVGWLLIEVFKMFRDKRKRQPARPIVPKMQLDSRGSRLNDRVRSVRIDD
jgi:hypothetical protein